MVVNKGTSNLFIHGMHGTSGADVVEALWKFFIDREDSLEPYNAILFPNSLEVKASLSSDFVDVMDRPPHHANRTKIISLKIYGKF